MSQFSLIALVALAAVLSTGASRGARAQDAGAAPGESTTQAVADGAAETGPYPGAHFPPGPPSTDFEALEEVLVTAERIEGDGGGRRRATVGRDELDRTDETDMEGFFDEIDGLSTLGGDDQGNAFSIDGLSPDLGKVTLDGQGFGEGRGSGGFSAGDLPPDMIRRIDVYKVPTASMEEGGASGRVNLQLRNPVELAGPSTTFKGRLGYVPDKDNFSPSGNYFTGRASDDRKFGFMLSMSLSERRTANGSQDVSDWIPRDFDGTSASLPGQARNTAAENDQGNLFAGLSLGYRPRRSLDVGGVLFVSRKYRDTENHSLQHRFEKQRDVAALAFDGRIATELESNDPGRRNLRVSGSRREDRTDSVTLALNLNWRRPGWRFAGAVGHGTVKNESDAPSRSLVFESNSAFGYRANGDGSLSLSYAGGFPPLGEFATSRINLSDRNTEDTNDFAGIDVTRQIGDGFVRRLNFGAKYREMGRSRRDSRGRLNLDDALALAEVYGNRYHRTPWDALPWRGSDLAAVDSMIAGAPVEMEPNLLNQFNVRQRTGAAYLQADFRSGGAERRFLVGNVGARIVDTETRIAGYRPNGENPEAVTQTNSYTDVLPSFSIRMRVAERAALTLGAARVLAHPAFNDLAPGTRLNYADRTGRSGNPDLEPFRANLFLAEATWSPERGRRLRGNLAYRDVESYFALGEVSVEIEDDIFRITRPINGDDGYILTAGLKLDQNLRRLAGSLQNFAVSVSYTRNKSSTDLRDPYSGARLPLPNTAEQVARADLTYSKDRFAGKLSYQWRGKSLKAAVTESGLSAWNRPVGNLNLNLGWQLNQALRFNVDARNMLSEEQIQTSDYIAQLWRVNERDRSISATLRAKW